MTRCQPTADKFNKFVSEGKPHIILFPISSVHYHKLIVGIDQDKSVRLSSNLDFLYPGRVLARTVQGKFNF